MRKLNFFLTILILLIAFVACAGIQNIRKIDSTEKSLSNNNLKFMTFNIRMGVGIENPGMNPALLKSSKEKIEKIALAIKSIDPDVVALQEVNGSNQTKKLAKRLNLNYVYIGHKASWGLAMLSKHRILKANSKKICKGCKFKSSSGKIYNDPRIALVAITDINGKKITFINIHYHLGVYDQQVKATMELLRGINGPVVLMGDFNREQHHSEMKPIQDKFNDTCLAVDTETSKYVKETGTKIGGTASGLRIDYIFVDPEFFEVKNAGIVKEYRDASDHYAYFADVVPKIKE
jgi:endonuclease/exonuclease/phosphatase family metal-dependent hydrolase